MCTCGLFFLEVGSTVSLLGSFFFLCIRFSLVGRAAPLPGGLFSPAEGYLVPRASSSLLVCLFVLTRTLCVAYAIVIHARALVTLKCSVITIL